MRFKLTILLILLNVCLFGFLYYLDRTRSVSSSYSSEERLVIAPGMIQSVDRVRVTSSSLDEDWVFTRISGDRWEVSEPLQWKANRFAMDNLLSQLSFLRWDTRFSIDELRRAEQGLDTYGLETPKTEIHLENDNRSVRLRIGSATEIGNRLYLLSPDERHVMVVQRDFFSEISQDMSHYLEPQLVDIPPFEVRAVQVQVRDQGNIRTRFIRENNRWRFESPINAAADNESVTRMLDRIHQLHALEFPSDLPSQTGLDRPAVRLTVEGMGRREALIIGHHVEEDNPQSPRYAQLERYPAVFLMDASIVSDLEDVQERLRERRFLRSLSQNWTSLEIRDRDRLTTLQRLENGQWQVLFTNEAGVLQSISADIGIVEETIRRLRNLEAIRFASDAPSELDYDRFGLSEPRRSVRIQAARGQQTLIRFGNSGEDNLVYADTSLNGTVYRVEPYILSDVPVDPLHYRDRVLRSLPESAQVIEVRLIDQQTSEEPLRRLQSDELPAELADFIATTRVESYVPVTFSDPLRLGRQRSLRWQFRLEVEFISSPGAETTRTLEFLLSERLGGARQFAVLRGEHTVFVLPAAIVSALEEWIQRELPEEPGPPETDPEPEPLDISEEADPAEADPGS